jgi:di/tricarboxylate transporter
LLPNLDWQLLSFFAILIAAFGLLLTERLRNDIVALLIILALAVTGLLEPAEALSGFSSEPAIVVAAIFVLSGALHQTGLSDTIGGWIGRLAGSEGDRASPLRPLAVIMPSVALLSAFTHHLTTTAVMLPVTLNLSRERGIAPSKLLIPLSFAASLGTTITIIGAPAFLIASAVLQQSGRPGLGIFSIAPIGLALSAAGTVFMLLAGRLLLPDRGGGEDSSNRFRLDQYFTELTILGDSPFLEQTVEEVEADERYHFRVVGWVRGQRRLPRPYGAERLRAGDVLLIRTTPEEMVTFRQESGLELQPVAKYGDTLGSDGQAAEDFEDMLVQAVVAPTSDLVNRSIGAIDFRRRYGAIVVGIWRKRGWLQQEMSKIKLRPGDVLVLQGEQEALDRVANDAAFLMLVPFQGEAQLRGKAPLAGAIMLATVAAAALGWLSIEMAALAGAVAMILARCITPRQAYRAIDARIYIFIAGALPLGAAMQQSGASQLLAGWLQGAVGGWNQTLILLALFGIVATITQLMSDAATTALFAPVAVALAQGLGQPPEPYVVTVAMAAVAAFLTPIGHHGNLLVYGPGRYQFADFVRVGTPLTLLVALVVAWLAPILWPG